MACRARVFQHTASITLLSILLLFVPLQAMLGLHELEPADLSAEPE
jgi:hypothetical protein